MAQIESFKFQKDQDANDNGIPDQFEVEKFLVESKLKSRKLDLEEKKINVDEENNKKNLEIKNKQLNKPNK